MTRTLYWYLGREMLRVTILAVVALTLLMTVFGIIEPMREVGVSTDQVLELFVYLIPVMISLTLPIAALFAGTIVYGRFAQDNEFTAARASGVSTLSLLKPALLLGAVVTAVALGLSNFVAPGMLAGAERAVKNNIAGIVFPQLRTMNYMKWEKYLIHADEADPDTQTLRGVVVLDTHNPEDIVVVMASSARVEFKWHGGDSYAVIHANDPVMGRTSEYALTKEKYQPVQWEIPSPAKEKPSWYDWSKLVGTLRDPSRNREIDKQLTRIKQRICHDVFARAVAKAINSGGAYDALRRGEHVYEIRGAHAHVTDDESVRLSSGLAPGGKSIPVTVQILKGKTLEQIVTADSGKISADWSERTNRSLVTVELAGGVIVQDMSASAPTMREQWVRGELDIPPELHRRAESISLKEIYGSADELTDNRNILKDIGRLKTGPIRKLIGKIKAEMHGRVAYGASCFLLVAIGAALGLIFRGGHVISAFTIAMVPGAVVIIMIIMGKELVRNPGVSEVMGLMSIWGGILILGSADVSVYLYLARK